jgi:hypothetical protein
LGAELEAVVFDPEEGDVITRLGDDAIEDQDRRLSIGAEN